jgi:hypothetical protein
MGSDYLLNVEFLLRVMKMFRNQILLMVAQLCDYILKVLNCTL